MAALPAPIAGLTWRYTAVDDAAALSDLHEACYRVDGGYLQVESEYREELTHPANDVSADSIVGLDGSGAIVGYGFVFMTGGDRSKHRAFPFANVHPDHRRMGVGTALMNWMEARTIERFAAIPDDLARVIRVDAYDDQTDRLELFARFGYRRARYFIEMLADLSTSPAYSGPPGDIEFREWSDVERSAALEVHNQAFADHWGSEPISEESWEHRFGDFAMPRASFVAYDGDRAVSYVMSSMYPHDFESRHRTEAWVEALGTITSHRRRGIASALILRVMEEYRATGLDYAVIGVDAENPTGAVSVYESLGFISEKTSITFVKDVT